MKKTIKPFILLSAVCALAGCGSKPIECSISEISYEVLKAYGEYNETGELPKKQFHTETITNVCETDGNTYSKSVSLLITDFDFENLLFKTTRETEGEACSDGYTITKMSNKSVQTTMYDAELGLVRIMEDELGVYYYVVQDKTSLQAAAVGNDFETVKDYVKDIMKDQFDSIGRNSFMNDVYYSFLESMTEESIKKYEDMGEDIDYSFSKENGKYNVSLEMTSSDEESKNYISNNNSMKIEAEVDGMFVTNLSVLSESSRFTRPTLDCMESIKKSQSVSITSTIKYSVDCAKPDLSKLPMVNPVI